MISQKAKMDINEKMKICLREKKRKRNTQYVEREQERHFFLNLQKLTFLKREKDEEKHVFKKKNKKNSSLGSLRI